MKIFAGTKLPKAIYLLMNKHKWDYRKKKKEKKHTNIFCFEFGSPFMWLIKENFIVKDSIVIKLQ